MQSLAAIPFFKDASDLDLKTFERRCVWKRVEEGQILVDFEDQSSDVYFLAAGDVRIQIRTAGGKEVILADMRSGEYFGELAAIDGIARSANVSALTRAEICIVSAGVFREMLAASRILSDKLLRLLAARVRDLNTRLLEHTVLDIRHRLYAELLRLSAPRPSAAPARVISPPPVHHVLAARVGCRREQITRELGAMKAENLMERTRGALVLLDPDTLRQRIAQAMREAG
ncbi:MAG: Crp/Fnr family transcriptional regulator [Beijerinckiaceae bacterium]|jgi:CRP/FNR family cyclic AMP-dependent transcriptional regulator|nr:Crp/Fnr family transcriptional regulator [Beijerinckiaceae bacterium]